MPLGGNGFTGPHSAYALEAQLAGDASGGTATVACRMDERFVCLVSYMACRIDGAAADVDYQLFVIASETVVQAGTMKYMSFAGSAQAAVVWTPPPILLSAGPGAATSRPLIRFVAPNTNGDTYTLGGRIYNFDKRVRESVPIATLFASVSHPVSVADGNV